MASTNSSGIKTQTPVAEVRAIVIPLAVWPRIAFMALSAMRVTGGVSDDWGKRGDWTMIVIIDTGIGIPREFQYNILLSFNRVVTLPDRQNGTALVLPLVKSLTELRGGRVELASFAERSATITILLPQESRLVCKAAG